MLLPSQLWCAVLSGEILQEYLNLTVKVYQEPGGYDTKLKAQCVTVLHLMLSLHMDFGCLSLHVTTYCNQIICVSKHLRSPVDRKERPIKLDTLNKVKAQS